MSSSVTNERSIKGVLSFIQLVFDGKGGPQQELIGSDVTEVG